MSGSRDTSWRRCPTDDHTAPPSGPPTPSGLPTWARIGIGVAALAAFLAYIAIYGSRAVRAGFTGDLTGPGSATELAPMSG